MNAMQTYTLHLDDGPIEIQARDITEASALARHNVRVRGQYGTFRLVNDTTGKINHVQRYKDAPNKGWVAAADSPLRGPFHHGINNL